MQKVQFKKRKKNNGNKIIVRCNYYKREIEMRLNDVVNIHNQFSPFQFILTGNMLY